MHFCDFVASNWQLPASTRKVAPVTSLPSHKLWTHPDFINSFMILITNNNQFCQFYKDYIRWLGHTYILLYKYVFTCHWVELFFWTRIHVLNGVVWFYNTWGCIISYPGMYNFIPRGVWFYTRGGMILYPTLTFLLGQT